MRDGWIAMSLSEVVEHTIGGVWGGESGTDEVEVTVVRSTEFTKRGFLNFETGVPRSIKSSQLKSRELKPGDILLEKSGGGPDQPVGRVVFVTEAIPDKFVCSNFVQLVRPNSEQIEPLLLFHIMWQWHAMNRTLEFQAQTTGIRNLRTPDYLEQEINLPPIPEQKRIVDLISSVDSYIESLQQQLEITKRSRNAVLHELMTAGGDGWVETKLGKNIHINTGKLDVNAATEFGKYPFFTCSRETYRIDEAAFEGECVLVAGNGDLNVKYYDGKFNAYQRTYVLNSVDRNILDNQFLFLYMQTYIEYLRSETRGTVIQYLKKGQFTDAKIKLPPLLEQKRIVDNVSQFDSLIESTESAITESQNLRSGLLSDLLSGKHEIPASYDKVIGAE